MALTNEQIATLVASPSLGAISYQGCTLIQELHSFTEEEYPSEACRIRDVFLTLTEAILEQLWDLYDPDEPLGARGDPGFDRTRSLARALHNLYSYLRYLRASVPGQTPPGIQVALTQLTRYHFPKENGDPICLVRPQWDYNLEYVPLTWNLKRLISPTDLDPEDKLGTSSSDNLLVELWRSRYARLNEEDQKLFGSEPPTQLAILSFAGLDTHDTLLYPLLGHELGHFIDYSFATPLHLEESVRKAAAIRVENVQAALEEILKRPITSEEVDSTWRALVGQAGVCLREILADLLATRMLGFSFFAAHSEFLKTLADWNQPTVLPQGYPGIKLRLTTVFQQLTDGDYAGNVFSFLKGNVQAHSQRATPLLSYMERWAERLGLNDKSDRPASQPPRIKTNGYSKLIELAEDAVIRALPELKTIAARVIPDSRCARLDSTFFDRIIRLENDLPPTQPSENSYCFAEIMSASWAHQLLHGESREAQAESLELQFGEYTKTCRLALKAIELSASATSTVSHTSEVSRSETIGSGDSNTKPSGAGTLCSTEIFRRLALPVTDRRSHLSIVPLNPSAVQTASLDVRLGNWFAVARRARLRAVELGKASDEELLMRIGLEEVFVPPDKRFLIHPGDFVLGATLEFIALPSDLMAFVEGRSRLGRVGLIVATASQVAPGFHGVIVLELANAGTVPLEVKPGIPIAQLVFQTTTEPVPDEKLYRGPYHCQIKPVLRPPLHLDGFLKPKFRLGVASQAKETHMFQPLTPPAPIRFSKP